MNIKITVSVFRVDNRPIKTTIEKPITVLCYQNGKTSDATADSTGHHFTCIFQNAQLGNEITITVSHKDFYNERVNINATDIGQSPIKARWTNHTCTVSVSRSDTEYSIAVRFVLSHVQKAPTFWMDPASPMNTLADGVLRKAEKDSQDTVDYLNLRNGSKSLNLLAANILANPNATDGWKRLDHVPASANPAKEGSFHWLEYGKGLLKYLVAIFVPKNCLVVERTKRKLDFVILYTPTTQIPFYELRPPHTYPYGLNAAIQPYSNLAQKYLFHEDYLIAYQLLAAKMRAIMVMPMCKFGDWGPFALPTGAHRMLLEVAHYVHKEHLYQDSQQEPGPIPEVRRVIAAAFSAGNAAMIELRTAQKQPLPPYKDKITPRDNPPAEFFTTDRKVFDALWTELWDIDLSGDVRDYEKKYIEEWLGTRPDRRFRIYRSQGIAGEWRPSNSHTIWTQGDPRAHTRLFFKGNASGVEAEVLHEKNERWSLVYFSLEYLHSNSAGAPRLAVPDAETNLSTANHMVIPRIAFGHAALMSIQAENKKKP